MNTLKWALAAMTLTLVAACGGGGNAGTSPFGSGGCSEAASGASSSCTTADKIDVIASSVEVGSGGDTITVSAIVKDKNNVGLASAPITFTATNGSLTQPQVTTNASGVATVTFAAGADRSNRTATITANSGKAKGTINIDVVGTKLEYQGSNTMTLGSAPVPVAIKATDSKGAPVSSLPITVTSSLGNGLSATSLTTNATGTATVDYTATNAGTDNLVFTGGGTSKPTSIEISASQFAFIAPAASASIPVNSSQIATVEYLISGVPQASKVINFSTTSGVVTPSATTDALGRASVVISATTAGPGTVQATVSGGAVAQATLSVNFVSLAPARLVLQISPTAIGPNAAGSTTNQTQLRATVTDVNGNPVSNTIVAFTRLLDPSGGNLPQPSAVTDSSGQATVQYVSGPGTTSDGGIQLRASVLTNPAIFGDASMTVTQSALFIGLGTGNVISNLDEQTYKKDWVVYVSDSNGVPVANKDLTIKVLPVEYRKGHLVFATTSWVYHVPSLQTCANEDTDYTGILTPAKDFDMSGDLQPGNVVRITTAQTPNAQASGIARTDSNGQATITLLYAESYAPWVKVRLTAQATVSGTESTTYAEFYVPGSAEDFSSVNNPPAGVISPFGENPCNVPR
jgi:hypothetical protein